MAGRLGRGGGRGLLGGWTAVCASSRRAFSASALRSKEIHAITVFGSGLMGAGIVQAAASSGYQVTMVDISDKAVSNGHAIIQKSLSRVAKKQFGGGGEGGGGGGGGGGATAEAEKWIKEVQSRIKGSTSQEEGARSADLIVEAIVENMERKHALFKSLDGFAKKDAIFASNTSSLPIGEIASCTSDDRQSRFGGLHFFNPVAQMKLVEVIKTDKTSEDTFESLVGVVRKMKKNPTACRDTPGFIVNRLLVPYMAEAIRLVERGDATKEDVDTAMKFGAGYPMGPIELTDFVGLDTTKFILDGWRKSGRVSADFASPIRLLDELVEEGKLGAKSGEGFYKYKDGRRV